MQWDGEDPAHRARHRDRLLRDYARRELGVFTPFYRRHLKELGVDPRRVRSLADLSRVRVVTPDDLLAEPEEFLAHPSLTDLTKSGEPRLALSLSLAKLTRRLDGVNRGVVEPRYKPIAWLRSGDVPLGYTDADLDLLAEAGSRVLSLAGLDRSDVLVGLTGGGADLAHWQLVLGARRAGITALHLGPEAALQAVVEARPTVLAGAPDALLRALTAIDEVPSLRAVLVVGADPGPGERDALARAAGAVATEPPAVVASWAPPGARAQWGECPDGDGYHTFPDLEILEVGRGGAIHPGGAGEVLWSALGWRGTVAFRLDTGVRAEVIDDRCNACGRRGPRVVTGSRAGLEALSVIEDHDGVAEFLVEFGMRDGAAELVVFLSPKRGADAVEIVEDLDGELAATQYVVLPRKDLDRRLAKAGSRVVDRR
ncbi:MAG: hypothetical protein HYU28_03215 [Actinobacteria bacterium]|nr:hypothetical protein [Actinomycetota bacterium]